MVEMYHRVVVLMRPELPVGQILSLPLGAPILKPNFDLNMSTLARGISGG